ncbi:MAG: ATP-binding protein, partial [Desulfobulbaceae bacterium]|nr:ATP-binding protein [Desulfobulbaceae bacterium]
WTLIVTGLLAKEFLDIKDYTTEIALNTARAHLNKDFSFRLWGSRHGGVYIPVAADLQPNPYLADMPERDIFTPSGRQLTLMNPEYMLRHLNDTFSELYGVAGHITSLKPLRPENTADAWETKALHAFESGAKEVVEIIRTNNDPPILRLMQPLFVKPECMACHGHQGYQLGDIRGGLGIKLPMAPFIERTQEQLTVHTISLTLLWVLGCAGLLFGSEHLRKNTNKLTLSNIGMQREIEERKRVESALQRESSFTSAILDTAGALIIVLNVQGEIIRFNQTSEIISGYHFREVAGKLFWEVLMPSEERQYIQRLFTFIQNNTFPAKLVAPLMTRGNERRIIDWANTSFRDEDGNIEYIISIGIDITEEKQLQNQLLHAEKLSAIGKLSASIAHEINNPLFGIKNVLERLREKGNLSTDNLEFTNLAVQECDRIRDLIKDLQNFNRPTSGIMTPVNLHKTINDILLLSKKEMESSHITIKKLYATDLGEVLAIADQIKQVLLNLLHNALEAMPKGGEITIITKSSGRNAFVSIGDTGSGISPADLDHIFEPFFTTKPAVKGTGLGLSVTYGIIKRHGGDIQVQSQQGKGTTFTITLPFEGK